MKKYSLYFFLLTILCSFSGEGYELIRSIPSGAGSITTDNLGNVYAVAGNQVIQFDSLGNQRYNFSENSLGRLKNVDAGNPLKILLFYPDFAQVVFLDSKLALQTKVNLRTAGIQQPLLTCIAPAGGFWVYDQQDFQLKRMHDNLSVRYESGNIGQALGYDIHPVFMTEWNNQVYMSNPATGILVFDQFGSYLKTIELKKINSFQLFRKGILFCEEGEIKMYDMESNSVKPLPMPDAEKSSVAGRVEKQKLFLLKKDKIELYSFKY